MADSGPHFFTDAISPGHSSLASPSDFQKASPTFESVTDIHKTSQKCRLLELEELL